MHRAAFVATLTVSLLAHGLAHAAPPDRGAARRNYDGRIAFNRGFTAPPAPEAERSLARFSASGKPRNLAVTYDLTTGAARTLWNPEGYLTGEASGARGTLPLALDFVTTHASMLGLTPADLAGHEVTDQVFSRTSGLTHLYLRQTVAGIPVYNGQLQVNVSREGRILSVNNAFVPAAAAAASSATPTLGLAGAIDRALRHAELPPPGDIRVLDGPDGVQQVTRVEPGRFSTAPVEGRLMWLPIRAGMLRLVWNFQVRTLDHQHWYDFTVDARSGRVWTRVDWVASDSYRVYEQPVESPIHTAPPPPADARTLASDPADALASPFAWHDTNGAAGAEFTTTQGNNAHAYTDTDANQLPDGGSSPDGGVSLAFDFAIDLTQAPPAYRPASVASLFYWSNLVHDVQYQYGFDEAAGNFQENNYGRGGAGGDEVLAEAQDGSGTNGGNFATPPDGISPRMQMFVWTVTTPRRDGVFDHGVVVHESGHGISNRLVGGPSNVSCLANAQAPGEGISDWLALVYTATAADTALQGRGIGTYLLGQPPDGAGFRTRRYSTDPAVNSWTYASINGMAIPHGVGSVWAQAAWEVYWALVDEHGFGDLYDAAGGAGNQRALQYFTDALKLSICSPTFTNLRDAVIQATIGQGGEDTCRVWNAFAAFGLGSNAVSGGPNSTSPTNGFDVPESCRPTVSVSDASVSETNATLDATFTVTLSAASGSAVTVDWATALIGGATSGADYTASSGTVTITAGTTTTTFTVPVLGDAIDEGPEYFYVNLATPTAATIADGQGRCLISDDDPPAVLAFGGAAEPINTEGDAASVPATFTVTLTGATARTVDVTFATGTAGTAVSGTDYAAKSGTLRFTPGQTVKTFVIRISGDLTDEARETYYVNLSSPINATIGDTQSMGTIVDDDPTPAGSPDLTIGNATVLEGDAGTTTATFTVTLSAPAATAVNFTYGTGAGGTATSGVDYVGFILRSAMIGVGQATKTVTVTIDNDDLVEGDETFFVNITSASNANIADGQGQGTITDDDTP